MFSAVINSLSVFVVVIQTVPNFQEISYESKKDEDHRGRCKTESSEREGGRKEKRRLWLAHSSCNGDSVFFNSRQQATTFC